MSCDECKKNRYEKEIFCDHLDACQEAYQQGRADEQLQSIEDAKEQAKEYRVALEKAKADGAREFLAWYSGGETMPSFGRYAKCNIDDVIAEWQKGKENE